MYSLGQFPALFLACLTLLAIVSMAVGKYYSVTKSLSLLKTREPPNIEQLNHDLQELVSMNMEYHLWAIVLRDANSYYYVCSTYVLL